MIPIPNATEPRCWCARRITGTSGQQPDHAELNIRFQMKRMCSAGRAYAIKVKSNECVFVCADTSANTLFICDGGGGGGVDAHLEFFGPFPRACVR